jgi:hypothetical protein
VGVFTLTKLTAPLPLVVKLLLAKANLVLEGFALGSNAGTMRLLVAPGLRPVTDPLLTPVIAVPVVPGLRAALVKNGTALGVTPFTAEAIVGATSVTTVVPCCPLTPFTTLAKVWFTPVTHVSAEAEANSAALRLPTVSAARSVRLEADANSANRTAGRRGPSRFPTPPVIVCA